MMSLPISRQIVPYFVFALFIGLVVSCSDDSPLTEPAEFGSNSTIATDSSSIIQTARPIVDEPIVPTQTKLTADFSSTATVVDPTSSETARSTPTTVVAETSIKATETAVVEPVVLPQPTTMPDLEDDLEATPVANTTTVSSTPTSTSSPTVTLTPTATLTPTVTSTPTVTPTLAPTQPPTPTPNPTSTPITVPDDRYGVIASGNGLPWQLQTLGVKWFIDYRSDPRGAPAGTHRVPFISVKPGKDRISPELMAEYASGVPGSYWYIGGETNVGAQDGISPAAYVVEFDYYVPLILEADPTAKILGPSVLNWDFSCTGCSWNNPGENWMPEFVSEYALAHGGTSPPIDAWAIDAYPLTWAATPDYPNPLPMTEWQLAVDQVVNFRTYLEESVPGHANTPIWITEMASHWAYDSVGFESGIQSIPVDGIYRWEQMNNYVANLSTWLNSNAATHGIERWFLYRGYINISDHARSGYAGIYLFESGDTGAALTPTGEVYSEFAKGIRK